MQRIFFLIIACLLLTPAAQAASTTLSVKVVSSGQSGSACSATAPAGGPVAPAGFHWVMTVCDDFRQDTTVNRSLWTPLNYTPSTSYVVTTNGMSFDSTNGIALQPSIDPNQTTPPTRVALTSAIYPGNTAIFSQHGGYWEFSAKYPTDVAGEGDGSHPDIWFRAMDANGVETGSENDLCEKENSTGNQTYCYNYVNNELPTLCVQCYAQPYPFNVALGSGFHLYSMYWNTHDGSPYGTESAWFDGVQQSSYRHVDSNWANPAVMVFSLDGCMGYINGQPVILDNGTSCDASSSPNNPMYMQFVRVWQAVPN